MKYAARTDVGNRRTNNEDSYLIDEYGERDIFIVADGMGGHNAGEVASLEACRKVDGYIRSNDMPLKELMERAVTHANKEIFIHAMQNEAMRGMGTTADVCVLEGNKLTIAHVGDSSVFILSKHEIRKITKDHSVVGEMVAMGTITEEEAKTHPNRHYITRAVGTAYTIDVDMAEYILHDGEYVLMCSDGLTDMVDKSVIHEITVSSENMAEAADRLVRKAKENGGLDNITLIIFGKTDFLHSVSEEADI